MKTISYSRQAAKDLRKYGNMAERVVAAVEEHAMESGAHANNVTRLVGSTSSRLRVGHFRVILEETETQIPVTGIGPRGGICD
jgi:mRNA interferase RelE/StbE